MDHHRTRPDRPRAPRLLASETTRVWLLNGALVAAALALLAWLGGLPAPAGAIRIPWWALAAGFAAAERLVVHVHFRRSAHTVALGEIPLVLGLLFSAPAEVVLAWVSGAGLVLALQRDHPRIRLVFNLAQFATTGGVAAALFHLVAEASPSEPVTWAAAGGAALASDAVASLLVGAAMVLSGERMTLRRLVGTIAGGSCAAAANASLALAAAVVIEADPRGAVFLLAPAAAIFVAYRAYMAERNEHRRLELLYDASRALTRSPTPESGLAGLLAMLLETFRAEMAEAAMFPVAEGEPGIEVSLGPGDRVVVGDAGAMGTSAALSQFVAAHGAARLVDTGDVHGAAGAHFRERGVEHAIVAALPGERGAIGAVVVANRLGVGGAFGRDEVRLFETLANHTGATLEQRRLGRAVSELREIQRHLEHQAFHDPLTGLANRLLFEDRVAHALSRRTGSAAVLYIDLDDFKQINDTLGHEAGDELLRETGRRLCRTLRPADTPARLGGDEFAVLVMDIAEEHARVVARRVLDALAVPFALAGREVPVHASLGLAVADSGTVSAEQLVRNADVAMYVSKHGGKRGYSVYERGMELAAARPGAAPALEAVR
jgi:diguanylate cyclase (GGDEF)-like protein